MVIDGMGGAVQPGNDLKTDPKIYPSYWDLFSHVFYLPDSLIDAYASIRIPLKAGSI